MADEPQEPTSKPKAISGLTEGRSVHYVLPPGLRAAGQHRPAIITQVLDPQAGTVHLTAFLTRQDTAEGHLLWPGEWVQFEPNGTDADTWHWIEPAP